MIKVWMFPPSTLAVEDSMLREYQSLSIVGPPGLPQAQGRHIRDGEVYIADDYAFIKDDERGRTYVYGLQTVQLEFEHLEAASERVATAITELVEAVAAQG